MQMIAPSRFNGRIAIIYTGYRFYRTSEEKKKEDTHSTIVHFKFEDYRSRLSSKEAPNISRNWLNIQFRRDRYNKDTMKIFLSYYILHISMQCTYFTMCYICLLSGHKRFAKLLKSLTILNYRPLASEINLNFCFIAII